MLASRTLVIGESILHRFGHPRTPRDTLWRIGAVDATLQPVCCGLLPSLDFDPLRAKQRD